MQQPPNTHLAQVNIARAVDDLDSVRLRDFVSAIDRVNAVAERSLGFVWRLVGDGNNATDIVCGEDRRVIINLSVWQTPEPFEHFVWNTIHKRVYEKKAKWFEAMGQAHFAMWWVPAGQLPSPEEAMAKLQHLRNHGPSAEAFGWESLPNVRLWMEQRCG